MPVQTAWALLGLLGANGTPDPGLRRERAIERGVAYLISAQGQDGTWTQRTLSGVFNRNCMIHYDNYRHVMPLWALSRHHRLSRGE